MRKIHVTRQFFEASRPRGHFLEKKKTKKSFLDKVYGSMCTKFQVRIIFSLAKRLKYKKYTHIQVKLGISSTGCSPHVDFDKNNLMGFWKGLIKTLGKSRNVPGVD